MTASIRTIILQLAGMHCPSCAVNLDLDLEDLPGVVKTKTNFTKQQLTLEFDSAKISYDQIITAIQKAGYTAGLITK